MFSNPARRIRGTDSSGERHQGVFLIISLRQDCRHVVNDMRDGGRKASDFLYLGTLPGDGAWERPVKGCLTKGLAKRWIRAYNNSVMHD